MGAGSSCVQYDSPEAALAAGETQEDVNKYLASLPPQPGSIWSHYKHTEQEPKMYKVLSVAGHTEEQGDGGKPLQMVVYTALYGDKQVWVRPLSMWREKVSVAQPWPDGDKAERPRFVKVKSSPPPSVASMKTTALSSGCEVPRVILGGWQLSAGHHENFDRNAAVDNLELFFSRGFSTFDMGDIYTGVEETVGRFIERCKGSAEARVAGSAGVRVHTKFVPDLSLLGSGRLTLEFVRAILRRSANRLGLQTLDVVQFHWWDYEVAGFVAVCKHLEVLQQEGLVRHLALTNFDGAHMKELLDAGIAIEANQVQYSLLDRRVEAELVPLCLESGVRLFCYGSLAGGLLTDFWLGKDEPPSLEAMENRSLVKYKLIVDEFGGWALFQELLVAMRAVADAHNAAAAAAAAAHNNENNENNDKSVQVNIAMVSIAWVLGRPAVASCIVGARNSKHVDTTLSAASLVLTESDHAVLAVVLSKARGPNGRVYALERDREGKHGSIMKYELGRLHTAEHADEFVRRAGEARLRWATHDGDGEGDKPVLRREREELVRAFVAEADGLLDTEWPGYQLTQEQSDAVRAERDKLAEFGV